MNRRAAATFLGAAALLAVAAGMAHGAVPGSASQSRIVDRTLLCRPLAEGNPDVIRIMRLSASRGNRTLPPSFTASDRSTGESYIQVAISTGPARIPGGQPTGGVWLSRTPRCSMSRLRVALSSAGLEGATTQPYGASGDHVCNVPATVLIRIRAVFRRPTALAPAPGFPSALFAPGTIENGYLAITTVRGRKPIAFASLTHATGKARLFLESRRCYAD